MAGKGQNVPGLEHVSNLVDNPTTQGYSVDSTPIPVAAPYYPSAPQQHVPYPQQVPVGGEKVGAGGTELHHVPLAAGPSEKRILGMRRTVFILVVVIVILVLAGLIGGLVGGLHAHKKIKSLENSSRSQSNSGTPTNSAPPQATVTEVNGVYPECPSADNTKYIVPGTNQTFLKQCNTNYDGGDFAHTTTTTMDDCLSLCAKYNSDPTSANKCVSVSWAYYGEKGTEFNYCWMKNVTANKQFVDLIESAILVSG